MLVDHRNPEGDRDIRSADLDRAPIDLDDSGIRLEQAVGDAHQRRFAGAVLADDAMDAAALEGDRDAAIGAHRAESLFDPDQLEGGSAHWAVGTVIRCVSM